MSTYLKIERWPHFRSQIEQMDKGKYCSDNFKACFQCKEYSEFDLNVWRNDFHISMEASRQINSEIIHKINSRCSESKFLVSNSIGSSGTAFRVISILAFRPSLYFPVRALFRF